MKTPNFVPFEFVDNNALNNAFGVVSGAIAGALLNTTQPGLVHPEAATLTVSGFVLTAVLNTPFSAIFNTGDHISAHGLLTNVDTQTYTVNFSGTVPGSGTITAYCSIASGVIQQGPFQVVGPPPGHPDYNPSFQPYSAYAQNVETLVLNATTSAPNNTSAFELCRFTISAGASGLTAPNTGSQVRSTALLSLQNSAYTTSTTIPANGGSQGYVATVSGITFSLPLASGCNQVWVDVLNQSTGTINVQVQGSDTITGWISNPTVGQTIVTMPVAAYVRFGVMQGNWRVLGSSQFGVTASGVSYIAAQTSGFAKFTNSTNAPVFNGQGASAPTLNIAPAGNIPVIYVSGGNPTGNPGIVGALWIN